MRISNGMMTDKMLYNLNRNLNEMSKYQWQTATGKKIQYASDDPIVASRAMKFRTDVNELEVYEQNASDAKSWLNVTEDALITIDEVLQRVRELTVGAATGTQTPEDKQKTAKELEELKQELITVGNSTYAGKYIFSGFKTDTPLFDEDGEYNIAVTTDTLNGAERKFNVGAGVQVDTSLTGFDVFGVTTTNKNFVGNDSDSGVGAIVTFDKVITADDYTDGNVNGMEFKVELDGVELDISIGTVTNDAELLNQINTQLTGTFGTLNASMSGGRVQIADTSGGSVDLEVTGEDKFNSESELITMMDDVIQMMNDGDNEGLSNSLEDIDEQIEKLLINRAEVGAKDKRIDLTINRIKSDIVTFTGLLSENEDVDMAETLMYFQNAENIYRASLSVSSKAIQPTLVDFIK